MELVYRLKRRVIISAAHHLALPYQSACTSPHGHNWIIEVEIVCPSTALTGYGMVVDFKHIDEAVEALDHTNLNEILEQPTAENIAAFVMDEVTALLQKVNPNARVASVRVIESENSEIILEAR